MLRTLFHSILTGALLCLSVNAKVTRAPYIQLSTDSSQVIVWRTDSEMKPVVRIGKTLDKLDTIVPPADILVRRVDKDYIPGVSLWKSEEKKKEQELGEKTGKQAKRAMSTKISQAGGVPPLAVTLLRRLC